MHDYAGMTPMSKVTSIDELRSIAERRVPRAFFQYADHGAYTQATMRANRSALEAIGLRQRVGIDVGTRSLATTIAGEPASFPLVLAPVGLTGMATGRSSRAARPRRRASRSP